MKPWKLGTILSMCCFLLASCQKEPLVITRNLLADEPDRFICERAAPEDRPAIPPAYRIDWGAVQTVEQARAEHDTYVASIVARNGVVAGYLVVLEDRLFTCWNNMTWQREVYEALPSE